MQLSPFSPVEIQCPHCGHRIGLSHKGIDWSFAVPSNFGRALMKSFKCQLSGCLWKLIHWADPSPVLAKTQCDVAHSMILRTCEPWMSWLLVHTRTLSHQLRMMAHLHFDHVASSACPVPCTHRIMQAPMLQ